MTYLNFPVYGGGSYLFPRGRGKSEMGVPATLNTRYLFRLHGM